ncbi:MAG: hypothetical protein U0936_10890 [Planctomycetaceae bacterium]
MAEQNPLQHKQQQLESLRAQVRSLESELAATDIPREWKPQSFYSMYYITVGFVLGGFAAMVSLLFNVIGATVAGKYPLEIIRVYLTFPLGEKALPLGNQTGGSPFVIDDGMILALGCCLYIGTGMVLGSVFHAVIARFTEDRPMTVKLIRAPSWNSRLVRELLPDSFLAAAIAVWSGWITDGTHLPWWSRSGNSHRLRLVDGPDGTVRSLCPLQATYRLRMVFERGKRVTLQPAS